MRRCLLVAVISVLSTCLWPGISKGELPWYVGSMAPTESPPAVCHDAGPPLLSGETFDVGCVDARTGTPVECLARFRTWFDLDEVPSGGRIEWLGWHDHDPSRVNGPFSDLVGDMWSMLDPKPPGSVLESFGGRTGRLLWPSFKMMPVVAGVVRIKAEYTTLDPSYHFVERWPWKVDPADHRYTWLQIGVNVRYPGLVELPRDESLYVRCGLTSSCAGTDNVWPDHPSGFYGTPEMVEKVRRLARAFRDRWGMILTITDMTLPWGGLWDISNTWAPPHSRHRRGRSVDISRNKVWEDTPTGRVAHRMTWEQEKWLRDQAARLGLFRIAEKPIHFELKPALPVYVCKPAGIPAP